MNSELVFYLATKTNLCEKAVTECISDMNIRLNPAKYATTPSKLGELVIDAFERAGILFIVGGLTSFDSKGIENVLSRALAGKDPDDVKKLKNPFSPYDGYLVRKGSQLMIVLPDDPDAVRAIMTSELESYLIDFTFI
ncbi:MAG: hypothetical protein J1E96_07565 [Ruminococcus sp.]|nr:hypothetical protein [Ruminococcus sp.]